MWCFLQAHRVVLASCSDYFRAMFTDAMRESRQSEICLNGVTAAGMRLLLDYAYTSRLALNLANIQDVLSAANHVQVVAVVEACSNYLQVQLMSVWNMRHLTDIDEMWDAIWLSYIWPCKPRRRGVAVLRHVEWWSGIWGVLCSSWVKICHMYQSGGIRVISIFISFCTYNSVYLMKPYC